MRAAARVSARPCVVFFPARRPCSNPQRRVPSSSSPWSRAVELSCVRRFPQQQAAAVRSPDMVSIGPRLAPARRIHLSIARAFPSSDFASRRSLVRVPVGVVEFCLVDSSLTSPVSSSRRTLSSVASGLHAGCRRLLSLLCHMRSSLLADRAPHPLFRFRYLSLLIRVKTSLTMVQLASSSFFISVSGLQPYCRSILGACRYSVASPRCQFLRDISDLCSRRI
jgi:hypothetical protein